LQRTTDAGRSPPVIGLGDGVRWEGCRGTTVWGAWSCDMLRRELAKIRQMDIEPIPMLNSSVAHDAWLRDYSRMVSTWTYHKVCAQHTEEALDLFDTLRFFHLGMDQKETADHRRATPTAWWPARPLLARFPLPRGGSTRGRRPCLDLVGTRMAIPRSVFPKRTQNPFCKATDTTVKAST
jgi:hypothetical protein